MLIPNPAKDVAQIVKYVLIAVATGIVIRFLIKKLRKPLVTDSDIKQQEKATGQKQTYFDNQYKQFADAIFQVMDKSSLDEAPNKILYNTIEKLQNEIDWLKLVQAYGTRQLRFFGFPDGNPKNLIEALSSEKHLSKVEQIMAEKGIII